MRKFYSECQQGGASGTPKNISGGTISDAKFIRGSITGSELTDVTIDGKDPLTANAFLQAGQLTPTAGWDSVPSYSDPVLGGAMNAQALALAARTELLLIESSYAISVLSEGAKADSTNGLDGTDSTAAFLSAVAKCKTTGKALRIPKMLNGYRLTGVVDVRGINVLDNDATLYINHAGIGIIFGGNASNANSPSQSFGTITRVTGAASRAAPDMRGIGVKGQRIKVERCNYFQIYANEAEPNRATDYSSAYSTLTLKRADTIDLYGENGGWINENIFHLNRTNKILFADGPYHHNHNKFHDGTMEGIGLIDMPVGSNNYFYGLRLERLGSDASETLTVNFGAVTWNNIVEATWISSPVYTNEPYNPLGNQVIVNDLGRGNAVYNAQDTATDEETIFALSESTPFVSYANTQLTGTLAHNTDMHGVRYIQHLVDGRFKCTNNFTPLLSDDRRIPVRNGDMLSILCDAPIFRPAIWLYDMAGNLMLTEPSDSQALVMPGKVWNADGCYTLNGNTANVKILVGTGVSAVRVQINLGGSVNGLMFRSLRVTGRFYKNSTNNSRKPFGIPQTSRRNSLPYFNASDISMANIAEGLPCYKNDMTEMKINHLRQRYLVKTVAGNVITTSLNSVQNFDIASCFVVYSDGATNQMVPVSAVSGQTITLTNPVPAEIVAGSNIDFIVTKTKVLA